MKKRSLSICAMLLIAALLAEETGAAAGAEAAGVPKLKQKKLTIVEGKTGTITVKGKRIVSKQFKSSQKSVAIVTKKGRVKGKKTGSCRIQVVVKYRKSKAGKVATRKLSCKVKVIKDTTKPKEPSVMNVSAEFAGQVAQVSVDLMKKSTANDIKKGENVLISPESVLSAMAMVVNGARGTTKTELQKALYGAVSVEDFNKNMSAYNDYLMSSADVKFHIANSIWIRNDTNQVRAKKSFLDMTEKYYHSQSYLEPFDNTTVEKINNWVKTNTDEMIPGIINGISAADRMYLINALAFEGKWEKQYTDYQVKKEKFTTAGGEKQQVSMLNGREYSYLQDDKATGMMKYYEGSKFAFAAILPNKDVSVEQYMSAMTGESFVKLIQSAQNKEVLTKMPEFSYDYETALPKTLQSMGIRKAFTDSADFRDMATTADGILCISDVRHKTHIDLDRNGTRAAAVTFVAKAGAAAPTEPPKEVYLDRPFLYAIVEVDSGLPVFMGVVNTVK